MLLFILNESITPFVFCDDPIKKTFFLFPQDFFVVERFAAETVFSSVQSNENIYQKSNLRSKSAFLRSEFRIFFGIVCPLQCDTEFCQ